MIPWGYGSHDRVPMDTTEIEASMEDEAKEYLGSVEARFRAKGINCRSYVLHGVPWDKIVSFAGSFDDMMVAISTHGRSGIPRLVMGSVADMVIKSLETPALVVRPL